jgi:hypothetical protein
MALSTIEGLFEIENEEIQGVIDAIVKIFKEGDSTKIEAIRALLYALVPKKTEKQIMEAVWQDSKRNAMATV